jgi:imidazolonepropionase-like amidohydrolase
MARIAFTNATLFDSVKGVMRPKAVVVVEGERIVQVAHGAAAITDAEVYDLAGRWLLPGLIDCHVHVTAVHHDTLRLSMQPPSLITAQAKDVLEGMLARGFTTVRDAAGADFGLQEAVQRGLFAGPRLYISGYPLSQTGGHADARPKGAMRMFCTCAGLGLVGAIADGVGEVRKAAREQLRNGANQIKIMAGGGVASPTDPIDGTQYSLEEMRAICEEAAAANTYVMAHAYSPASITRAVQSGVRTIEHGNLLDVDAARAMKAAGAFLVPTLATYAALADEGRKLGWSDAMYEKLERVRHQGVEAIRIAKGEGVPIAFGTDLLGSMHSRQATEYALRSGAMSPLEVLQSATSVGAEVLRATGKLGVIAEGAFADLLVAATDPAEDLSCLASPEDGLLAVMKAGRFFRNSLKR